MGETGRVAPRPVALWRRLDSRLRGNDGMGRIVVMTARSPAHEHGRSGIIRVVVVDGQRSWIPAYAGMTVNISAGAAGGRGAVIVGGRGGCGAIPGAVGRVAGRGGGR